MKIAFIIGSLDYSGAEKIARYLIASLYEHGHKIGVLLLSKEITYPEFSYVKQYPLLTKGNTIRRVVKRQQSIRKIVLNENYDVVVSFGVKFNLDVMEALRGTKVRVILCERNDPYSDPHNKLLRIRRRLVYPFAAGFVFQTEVIAEFFGKRIRNRSVVIPNFIENRLEYMYEGQKQNTIVYTGRLDNRQKNLTMLLRAFARFSKHADYQLYLVGDGPDRKMLEQLVCSLGIVDNVVFAGRQNVYDYLKLAQFYVLPSNYEGMPNSLIEAMGAGIPCIATNCSGGGAASLVENNANGLLIPVNNEDALLQAMEEMANSPELRKLFSLKAYEINDKLDFSKIITMWIEYIESIVGRKNLPK